MAVENGWSRWSTQRSRYLRAAVSVSNTRHLLPKPLAGIEPAFTASTKGGLIQFQGQGLEAAIGALLCDPKEGHDKGAKSEARGQEDGPKGVYVGLAQEASLFGGHGGGSLGLRVFRASTIFRAKASSFSCVSA